MAHNIFGPCECEAWDQSSDKVCKCNCHTDGQGWREGTFMDEIEAEDD